MKVPLWDTALSKMSTDTFDPQQKVLGPGPVRTSLEALGPG